MTERSVILGTAGHIDHGKTSLVRALTGTQLDRRPEERRRGITIDLGFALLDLGRFRVGLVDVPGHEKFVGNMLAGAAGIEAALLVVAADDGVMPQTREHLAILDLLGVRFGAVALTKADLVDDTTRELATLEVRELLAGTTLADVPVVAVSSHTGAGIDELRAAILAACERLPAPEPWPFRLAIDRAFSVPGHGSVVTGSALTGPVAVGDELDWHAGTGTVERVRVRGLSRHNAPLDRIESGSRMALNIAGIPIERLHRGQELAAAGTLRPTRLLTVEVTSWPGAARPLKHRHWLRLHLGTADVPATLALLDCDQVRPGERALGQLFLRTPLAPWAGQRLVLRADSGEETLGGGRLLHPQLKRLRRRNLAALEALERLGSAEDGARLTAAVYFTGYHGVEPAELPRLAAVVPPRVDPLLAGATERGDVTSIGRRLFHPGRVARLEALVMAELSRRHESSPLMTSHDLASVLATLPEAAPDFLKHKVVERLSARKLVVGDARRVARADFRPKLSQAQRKLKDRMVADYQSGGVVPPDPAVYLPQAQNKPQVLADVLEVACAEGFLVRIAADFYLATATLESVVATIRDRLKSLESLATVGDIRDWLSTTRKFAVPLCEYLDRAGVTERDGDHRRLSTPKASSAGD